MIAAIDACKNVDVKTKQIGLNNKKAELSQR